MSEKKDTSLTGNRGTVFNKNKGITLIALVITIIVLFILLGISVAVLTGENGIIEKAQQSREATELAQIKEEISEKWYELIRENVDASYNEEEMAEPFQTKLRNTGDATATVVYNSDSKTFEVSYKGHELEIQANGKVTDNR